MKIVSILKANPGKTVQLFTDKQLKFRKFIIFLFFVTACGKQLPESNFSSERWQKDTFACQDKRQVLLSDFEKIRAELIGISEKDIQKLLGKPEATSLTDQSERIYFYYIEPGAQCTQKNYLSGANKVQVRINSLGFVTEIGYEQPLAK